MASRYWPTTENRRGSLFGYASYELDASWTLYVQGLYGHSNSATDKGPNLMYGAWAGEIFLDNAYLPEALRQQMVDAGVDKVSFSRAGSRDLGRSEEHTSELQSLMRISYAVFCLTKKKKETQTHTYRNQH